MMLFTMFTLVGVCLLYVYVAVLYVFLFVFVRVLFKSNVKICLKD